jgi:hypothetical protein
MDGRQLSLPAMTSAKLIGPASTSSRLIFLVFSPLVVQDFHIRRRDFAPLETYPASSRLPAERVNPQPASPHRSVLEDES